MNNIELNEDMQDAYREAQADDQLNSIDIDYIEESIEDQLTNLLTIENKQNYLKIFDKQLKDSDIDENRLKDIKESVYLSIIDEISNKFNIEIDTENANIKRLGKTMYKFFVMDYSENLVYFLEMYILENKEFITSELSKLGYINTKKIDNIDESMSIVLKNLSEVINIINSQDIDFSDYLSYISMHSEANAAVEEMIDMVNDCVEDSDEVFTLIIKPLVDEDEGFGEVFTELQMNLYKRFDEDVDEDQIFE